ncbi:MAG: hypothetical protein JW976_04565 [Syntrophaceae bacterium]|nr:hypothetical protein [Syntrophaceae bacterium]
MRKKLKIGLMLCLLVSLSGCLIVTDAPVPPECCPLFSGVLKASIGHSYAQDVKPNGNSFMKPTVFNIADDSRVFMYTYNDFAKANPNLEAKVESVKDFLKLDYDLEKAFVLMFKMHVTNKGKSPADYYGDLYFIVGSIQNDDFKGTARIEKFKIHGIGGNFDAFFTYIVSCDVATVIAPWVSITGDGKVKYDSKTGEPLFLELKGTINGVIPGQVIFEIPFQTELCDC